MDRSDGSTRRVSGAPPSDKADTGMATVSFSVPNEVKEAFDEAFTGRDKGAVIADLMREADERVRRRERRREAVGRVLKRRAAATLPGPRSRSTAASARASFEPVSSAPARAPILAAPHGHIVSGSISGAARLDLEMSGVVWHSGKSQGSDAAVFLDCRFPECRIEREMGWQPSRTTKTMTRSAWPRW